MAELTAKQKKDWAGLLYTKENLTQAEIAEKVGVSRQTVSKWIKTEKWEELKVGITMTREQRISEWFRQLANINHVINGRAKEERFPTKSEADIITQLTNAIEKMEKEAGVADLISSGTIIIKYIRTINPEHAKKVTGYVDNLIKERL